MSDDPEQNIWVKRAKVWSIVVGCLVATAGAVKVLESWHIPLPVFSTHVEAMEGRLVKTIGNVQLAQASHEVDARRRVNRTLDNTILDYQIKIEGLRQRNEPVPTIVIEQLQRVQEERLDNNLNLNRALQRLGNEPQPTPDIKK